MRQFKEGSSKLEGLATSESNSQTGQRLPFLDAIRPSDSTADQIRDTEDALGPFRTFRFSAV